MTIMYKTFSNILTQTADRSFVIGSTVRFFTLVFLKGIICAYKTVKQRTIKTLSLTLVFSVLLTACGGGGGGGGGSTPTPTPTPTPNTAPTLTIPNSNLIFSEDFATAQLVATATNATGITFNQSNTGVVNVTASTTGVSVESILNAHGRTTLTITATNGSLSSTAQVVVTVTPVNDTPTLTVSTNNISVSAGFSTITINTTASDAEDAVLTFAVDESPSGVVRVSPSANAIVLNAITGVSGQTTLTVSVVDTSGKRATQIISVRVVPLPSVAPVLTVSTNRISVQEDFRTPLVIRTTATDANGDTITLSVSSSSRLVDVVLSTLTNGLSTLTITAINNANGQTTLTITVSDGQASASTQVVVTVNAVNDTPTLSVSSNSISTLGGFMPITIYTTATDVEDTNISFTVFDAKAGVVTITTSTNAFMLNNIPGASGQTTLTVRVVDSSGITVTQSITVNVTITVSATPVVTISTNLISVPEDFGTSVIIQTTATDGDATDTITVSVSASMPIVTAVISTPINGQSTLTNSITLTAINNANGTATLTVLASDSGGQSTNTEIVVVVAPVQDAPTLNIPAAALTVAEDFASTQTIATASDVDGDSLLISVVQSTTGLVTVTTTASGVSVSSIRNINGQTTLTITVTDGDQDSTGQVVVKVTPVNDPPALSVSTTDLTLNEDFATPVLIGTTRSDIDSNTLTLTVSESTTGVVTVQTSSSGISVSSIEHKNGRTTLTITLGDSQLISTAQVVVTVAAVNDTPTFNIPSATLTVAEDFVSTLTIATANDVDNATLSITVSESSTGIVTVTTSASGVQIVSLGDVSGQTTLMMTVSDSILSLTTQVVVTVTPVNDPPVLTVSTTVLTLNEDFSTTGVITVTRSDIDSNTLTLIVSESTTGVVSITTTAAGVQVTNINNANGVTTLSISVSDGTLSSTAIVVVTVTPVNDPPTLSVSNNNLSINVDFSTITINVTLSDVEDSTLSFSVEDSSAGVVTITTLTNTIVLNAIAGVSGQTTLTVSLVDSSGTTVTQTIAVFVSATPNSPPVLVVSTNRITVQEEFMAGSVVIRTTVTDAEGGAITLSLSSSSRLVDAAISAPMNGISTITLTAIRNASGTATLTVIATDVGLQTDSTEIVVVVAPVEDTPTINIPTTILTVPEDFASTQTIATASDGDGDPLLISVVESTTGVVTVTTTASGVLVSSILNANGHTTLTITVSDGKQDTTAQMVVNVTAVNDPPNLNIPSATLTRLEDFAVAITVASASDIDSTTRTITVTESTTGVIRVTTSSSDVRISSRGKANGVTTLVISVSDGDLTTTAQVVVTVTPVNDPPSLTVSTNALTLAEDFATPVLIGTTRSDIDSNTLTLTVAESTTGVVTVTITDAGVQVASTTDTNGVTTLTISLSDGTTSTSIQVNVTVMPVNDPPTLNVSTTALTLNEDFATTEVITVSRSDIDSSTLTLTVSESATGVVSVTTTDTGVQVANITNANGRTTLTIQVSDGDGGLASTDVVVVVIAISATPVLTVSTNLIRVDEDFSSPVVIRTTATDADGDTLIVSISSSSHIVDAVLSTPVSGVSTITNMITLTALSDLSGITTLTVQAINGGGIATTQQIVVVVNAVDDGIPFTLSTSAITLTVPGSQLDRIVAAISISNPENKTLRTQIQVTTSGDNIFSANPTPVVSFTTNALTTSAILTSVASTAQLYFTIVPNSTGTGTLVVQLTDLDTSVMSQQTMVVQVNSVNVPPVIAQYSSNLANYVIYGGQIYANGIQGVQPLNPLLTEARALGAQLINFNSDEEYRFILGAAIVTHNTWWGLVLPKQNFPGELSWITHDSTIAYGFANGNGLTNLTVYPGHYPLPWNPGAGVSANRSGSGVTVINGTVYSDGAFLFLLQDVGDGGTRFGLYEFPQGLPSASNSTPINFALNATVQLTGYDLNGIDTINTANWSGTDSNGGSVVFTPTTATVFLGLQSVNMTYSPPANFGGQTTVVVTLTVGGLSTTVAKTFIVPPPPTIALSTNAITLDEDFGTFDIATTATEQGVSTSLPFSVQASTSGIVTISNSANNIRLSAIAHANGTVTLTVRTTDSASLRTLTQVVVTVRSVNDTPTVTVSSDSISILGGFTPITIYTTATDIEEGPIALFSVQASPEGVVSISTRPNTIVLSPIVGGSGRTTLTVSAIDGGSKTGIQTIAVNVMVTSSTAPVLRVSTNLISLQEDFGSVVIGTTATDAETGTLVVTVSSTTHLVNTVISTHGITLSSVPNIFGTTTLTVRARDDGGVFVSTELVVIVAPVNDIPTFTVSTTALTLDEDFMATVLIGTTGTDVENDTLFLSVNESTTGVVSVSTSVAGVQVSRIVHANGRTTLTVTISDSANSTSTQVAVNVIAVNDPPNLTVSTTALTLTEDFMGAVLIGTTRTDIDGDTLTLTVTESTSGVIKVTTSASGVNVENISHAHGQTTLTVSVYDGTINVSTQVVVTVLSVEDTPTISVSTNSINVLGGFTPITIYTTASDVEDGNLNFSVQASTSGVVKVTTSANAIVLEIIANASGITTLTVRTTDSVSNTALQTIVVNVNILTSSAFPVLSVSTDYIYVQEDFSSPVTIRTTATDSDVGDSVTIFVRSSINLVNTTVSTQTNNRNTISLTPIANLNGTATLTVFATDAGGQTTTTEIVVVVNAVNNDPVSFTLSTDLVTLSAPGSLLDRIVNNINISNPDNQAQSVQWRVISSGSPIFSSNPTPVVSFTTNALTSADILTSVTQSAQLYFSIRPDRTGTAILTLQLTNMTRNEMSEQTMTVQVNPVNVAPTIVYPSTRITNLSVEGGHLYANSVRTTQAVTTFLAEAQALGGHLININTIEELGLVNGNGNLIKNHAWYGLTLPQRFIPGELSWITNNSTNAYGFVSPTLTLTVYPGHFPLNLSGGLFPNGGPGTASNWTVFTQSDDNFRLLPEGGDINVARRGLYEFPQGLAQTAIRQFIVGANTSLNIPLTGIDLNGDAISTSNWSAVATSGTVRFSNISQSAGIQAVNMIYTAPSTFGIETTAVVTLQVNGLSTTFAVSFLVIEPAFTLPTNLLVLTENSSQTIRNQQLISNFNTRGLIGTTGTLDVQLRVTHSGDNIFSANPIPVISFSTTAHTDRANIGASAQTAQLYFSIAPEESGTATLTVQLTNQNGPEMSFQTMVVQVRPMAVPPVIAQASTNIQNLVVHGGRLYANSARSFLGITTFTVEARALGGHLININTVEEFNFVRNLPASVTNDAWFGLVLPQRYFNSPANLFWESNDRTIAYGIVTSRFGTPNVATVYPGHYPLTWDSSGLIADRNINNNIFSTSRFNPSNWAYYSRTFDRFLLLGNNGLSTLRRGLYEFPQGLAAASIMPISLNAGSSTTIGLTGFDLDGDMINTASWSMMDPAGGTSIFNSVTQSSGVQTVDVVYTAPTNFDGQTTVVVSLTVNGLTTTTAILITVDAPPNIILSTHSITLNEDFTPFVIGTTVTDQGGSVSLPFTVQASNTGVITITTSANAIRLSNIPQVSGVVTLTIQATDIKQQTATTLVTVSVLEVNDPPILTISSDRITTLGGFLPITINTTVTDSEDGTLPISVLPSSPGVVSVNIFGNDIILSPIETGSGQTTLTLRVTDSSNTSVIQTIAVNVIVNRSPATPVITVSTTLINVLEDFDDLVIRTTATDTDPGTLSVTVSSFMNLVSVAVTTQSITLSSVAHLFGTTTLTVRARDAGGLFDSTEVVVVVQPVNDTPTLTVSSQTVYLNSIDSTVLLTVSARDEEDGILSFSVSTGQGVVNTIITTSSLTIARMSLDATQFLLTVRATDRDSATTLTSINIVPAPLLLISTDIKTLNFAWSAISSATRYQLRSDIGIGSGYVDLSTRGIVVSPNSTDIRQTTAQGLVSLHRYIPRVIGPQYGVDTCNATTCDTSFRHNTVALNKAQLDSMIGRLAANFPDIMDEFGGAVSLSSDGNTLAVGAQNEDGSSAGVNRAPNNDASAAGAVYVFRRNGGVWSLQAYIKASNTNTQDRFGSSVSLSGDGNTLAVGSTWEESGSSGVNGLQTNVSAFFQSGAVYLFRFSTTSNTWSQQAYIKASNTGRSDLFSHSVSLSADGNTLAVGAYQEGSSSTGVNGAQNDNLAFGQLGAVYLFRFSTASNTWSQQAYIKASNTGDQDQFGWAVSLSGDGNTLAVGARQEYSNSTGVNGVQTDNSAQLSGAVYLFRFSTTSNSWSQQAYIKASNTRSRDQFGQAVSLSGDGNTLAVGAIGEDSMANDSGAVYVFQFNITANAWSQQAYLKASNAGTSDLFGGSVSLSSDGNTLAVGAQYEDGSAVGVEGTGSDGVNNSGATYVFEFNNGNWVQQAYIKADNPSSNDVFGTSVSLSGDGSTLAVGAMLADAPIGLRETGVVYLY